MLFLNGLKEDSFKTEEEANHLFAECLRRADGNKDRAWDIYYPYFRDRKIRCANKNIDNGGYAELNGDPFLESCWTVKKISWSSYPQFLLLGSDGLIPSEMMNPKHRREMTEKLGNLYIRNGLSAVLRWRDEAEKSLHHITGWPEASAIELKFS